MGVGPELGGLDLSSYAVFEAVARAAQWSVPAAQIMAIQAGVGAPAMLPALPEGPLATHVRRRITEGTVSGFGDTDHAGQNNSRPVLTATPTPDGTAYELTGDKLFIGNGTVADLLPVSAVLDDPDRSRVGVCFVDTRTPGFEVASAIEFMGSRGLPNGALRLHKVRVPREHVLVEGDGDRLPAAIGFLGLVGRLHFTGAPALAIARNCAEWSRDFVVRRTVDGRPLGDYEQIQRLVATTVAEVYAMESVARLGLIGAGLSDRWLEQFLAKNVLVRTAGRIADRTVSLLGAEGFETVASKRRRGAPTFPSSVPTGTPAGCASPATWISNSTTRPLNCCSPPFTATRPSAVPNHPPTPALPRPPAPISPRPTAPISPRWPSTPPTSPAPAGSSPTATTTSPACTHRRAPSSSSRRRPPRCSP